MTATDPVFQISVISFLPGQGSVVIIRWFGTSIWSFPKGTIDCGRNTLQTATTETLEECGCLIEAILTRIGTFDYKKRFGGRERRFYVDVFAATVIEMPDRYRESTRRERAFPSPGDAAQLVSSTWNYLVHHAAILHLANVARS